MKERRYAKVIPALPFDQPFDYRIQEHHAVQPGAIVLIPFGKRECPGVVLEISTTTHTPEEKIKPISSVASLPPFSKAHRDWLTWVASYTLSPLGSILALTLSNNELLTPPKPAVGYQLHPAPPAKARWTEQRQQVKTYLEQQSEPATLQSLSQQTGISYAVIHQMYQQHLLQEVPMPSAKIAPATQPARPITLSASQQKIADQLLAITTSNTYSTTLLHGITGSGKTEIYCHAIAKALEDPHAQILILLPEIILTTQLIQKLEERFAGTPLTLWHSALTPATRKKHWHQVNTGQARLIIGARSALFLPFSNLSMIIIDEEHDPSLKQEEGVCYHARDMAIARAHQEGFPVILSSATPSVETLQNAQDDKYHYLQLRERFGPAELPKIHAIDLRKNPPASQQWLSPPLRHALKETLAAKEQALLYLNRRGYAPLVLCRSCGFRFQSPDSSAWMVLHQPRNAPPYLQCHHSGVRIPLPTHCPECDAEESFVPCGPGVERLSEEVRQLFPDANILTMTSDSVASPSQAKAHIEAIQSGEVDIIIGTQMVAKGHHFPALTLVGIVDADLGLEGSDPRAGERTLHLLHQVSGRAGRAEAPGRVFLQTYMPDHPVMQAMLQGQDHAFMQAEISRRKAGHLPPFSRMIALILSGSKESEVREASQQLVRALRQTLPNEIHLLGPAPAPMLMLRGRIRYRMLVVAPKHLRPQTYLKPWLKTLKLPHTMRLKIDVDPQSFF